jgi:hypothetical protein
MWILGYEFWGLVWMIYRDEMIDSHGSWMDWGWCVCILGADKEERGHKIKEN